jgi:soluble lytic murein transglycosylase-like protein
MMTFSQIVALLALHCPLLPVHNRPDVAHIIERSGVDPALVIAVMHRESLGKPDACGQNPDPKRRHGSARGTMQVWVPGHPCSSHVRPDLYDVKKGTVAGIEILKNHLQNGTVWMSLLRYSGGSRRYADEVVAYWNRLASEGKN